MHTCSHNVSIGYDTPCIHIAVINESLTVVHHQIENEVPFEQLISIFEDNNTRCRDHKLV